jgi:hypothetical protein
LRAADRVFSGARELAPRWAIFKTLSMIMVEDISLVAVTPGREFMKYPGDTNLF